MLDYVTVCLILSFMSTDSMTDNNFTLPPPVGHKMQRKKRPSMVGFRPSAFATPPLGLSNRVGNKLLFFFIVLITVTGCFDSAKTASSGSDNTETTTGTIQGTVFASTGASVNARSRVVFSVANGTEAVAGALCTVEGTDKTGTTDQNGFFTINGVSPGSHILICKKTATDGTVFAFLKVVDVPNGKGASSTLDIGNVEANATGSIQGKSTLVSQTNSMGISVYIPGTSMQALTDATGAYLISNVPEGTYGLSFEKTGYATATLASVNVTTGKTTLVGDIALNVSTGATGSIAIDSGATYALSRTVTVSITASSDVTLMQLSEDVNFVGASWQAVTSAMSWTFSGDGEKRLYFKVANANGLTNSPVSDSIIVDSTAPAGGNVTINSGTSATNTANVTLALSATDATTGVAQMMVSNDVAFTGAVYEPYATTRSWSVPSGDGIKMVYARFKDTAGNETNTVSASITLDTALPTGSAVSIQEGAYTNTASIHLNLSASGATFAKISEAANFGGASAIPVASTTAFTLTAGDGNKTIYVKYLDDAGNETAPVSTSIIVDTVTPTTPVIFNQNQATNQSTFVMTLSTNSTDANFKSYQLKGGQYADWTDTSETASFSFTLSQQGPNVLYIRGTDLAGHAGSSAAITATFDNVMPVISNIYVSVLLGRSATILWNADETVNGKVDYGTDSNYGTSQSDANTGTAHRVTLIGLTELTTYHYKISSSDVGGNTATSTDLTFTTKGAVVPKYSYVVNAHFNLVNNNWDGSISQYMIGADGSLTTMTPATAAVGTLADSVTVDPTGKYAYVTRGTDGNISQYAIGVDGSLTAMTPATVVAEVGAQGIVVDPSGKFAYVANSSASSSISQYTIGADGSLTAMTPATVATGPQATYVTIDPTGKYAYVANSSSSGTVSQYTIGADGCLTAMVPATVAAGYAPRSVIVHPSGKYAYAGYGSIWQYTIGADGRLTAMSGARVDSGNGKIVLDPSGKYAYVTNTWPEAIWQYTIGADGIFTPMTPATVATGTYPRSIAVDPSGKYAYVTISISNNSGVGNYVMQYTIGANGNLTAMTPATVGTGYDPASITTVGTYP